MLLHRIAVAISPTVIVTLCALQATAPVDAASFDCSHATTSAEVTICADSGLSALDSQLGQSFSRRAVDTPAVRTVQRNWIRARDERFDKALDERSAKAFLRSAIGRRVRELDESSDAALTFDLPPLPDSAFVQPKPIETPTAQPKGEEKTENSQTTANCGTVIPVSGNNGRNSNTNLYAFFNRHGLPLLNTAFSKFERCYQRHRDPKEWGQGYCTCSFDASTGTLSGGRLEWWFEVRYGDCSSSEPSAHYDREAELERAYRTLKCLRDGNWAETR